jgi:hypothetical protein
MQIMFFDESKLAFPGETGEPIDNEDIFNTLYSSILRNAIKQFH